MALVVLSEFANAKSKIEISKRVILVSGCCLGSGRVAESSF